MTFKKCKKINLYKGKGSGFRVQGSGLKIKG